jgi:1,4-dihydroxy-2-naphthoate octaprenyltransferase
MSSIKTWCIVARLPSVILALTSIMLGTMLAIGEGTWDIRIAFWASLTGMLLQILANLANDYGDWVQGANVGARVGDEYQKGLVNAHQLQQAILLVGFFTLLSGLVLLVIADLSRQDWIKFAFLGLLASLASVGYTLGPRPYGYLGLGDIAVLVFFGFVGVLGTAYLYTKTWHTTYVLPALSCGCLAVGILNINNIRDQALDKAVRKYTLVVRIGSNAAIYYQWVLLSLSVVFLVIFTLCHYRHWCQWFFLILVPRLVQNGWMTYRLLPNQLDKVLQRLAIIQFLLLWLFGLGFVLSSYW